MSTKAQRKTDEHPDQITEIQRRIQDLDDDRVRAAEALEGREKQIQALPGHPGADPRERFRALRESLLADIATGVRPETELEKFDEGVRRGVEEYEAKVKAAMVPEDLAAMVRGLRKRLENLDQDRAQLVAERRDLWIRHLQDLAKEAATRYIAALKLVGSAMDRAAAIGALLTRMGIPNTIASLIDQFDAVSLGVDGARDAEITAVLPTSNEGAWNRVAAAETELTTELKKEGLMPVWPARSVATPRPEKSQKEIAAENARIEKGLAQDKRQVARPWEEERRESVTLKSSTPWGDGNIIIQEEEE